LLDKANKLTFPDRQILQFSKLKSAIQDLQLR
jgi:hypothetical protein